MRPRLALVPIHDKVTDLRPVLLYEGAAAKYVGMSRLKFRKLVDAGVFSYACHVGGEIRVYDREELDAYKKNLNWRKIPLRKVSLVASNEGVTE